MHSGSTGSPPSASPVADRSRWLRPGFSALGVTRAGVASGPGPFDLVPGALDVLDDNDRAARALLPDDPVAAAQGFARGFEPLASTFRGASPTQIAAGFEAMLSTHDRLLMRDNRLASSFGQTMKESLRQGTSSAGWDNVAWVGPWEVDPTTISCPVLLWYGEEDKLSPPAHGVWLRDNLPNAELVLRSGEGHLGFVEHTAEMLTALTAVSS
jgi:pimeloyl-ACP methyl ester carboxylesterase